MMRPKSERTTSDSTPQSSVTPNNPPAPPTATGQPQPSDPVVLEQLYISMLDQTQQQPQQDVTAGSGEPRRVAPQSLAIAGVTAATATPTTLPYPGSHRMTVPPTPPNSAASTGNNNSNSNSNNNNGNNNSAGAPSIVPISVALVGGANTAKSGQAASKPDEPKVPILGKRPAPSETPGGPSAEKDSRQSGGDDAGGAQRKMQHKKIEQRRRDSINEQLAVLQNIVCDKFQPKPKKSAVLAKAINKIKELKAEVQRLNSVNTKLKSENEALGGVAAATGPDAGARSQVASQDPTSGPTPPAPKPTGGEGVPLALLCKE